MLVGCRQILVWGGGTAGGCAGATWTGSCDDLFYCFRELTEGFSCCGEDYGRLSVLHSGLGWMEGDDRDLGGAVEAEGQTDGADTAIHVKLHTIELVVTFRIFLA